MNEFLNLIKDKKNRRNLFLILLLILAVPIGLFLLSKPQIFNPRANVEPIVFSGANVKDINGKQVLIKPEVTLQLTSKLGAPVPSGVTLPSPTPSPASVANPFKSSYTFSPNPPRANQKFEVKIEVDPAVKAGTFSNVALVIDGDLSKPKRLEGLAVAQVVGAPTAVFAWKSDNSYDGANLTAGNHTFQLVAHCEYARSEALNDNAPKSCTDADIKFNPASVTFQPPTGALLIDSISNLMSMNPLIADVTAQSPSVSELFELGNIVTARNITKNTGYSDPVNASLGDTLEVKLVIKLKDPKTSVSNIRVNLGGAKKTLGMSIKVNSTESGDEVAVNAAGEYGLLGIVPGSIKMFSKSCPNGCPISGTEESVGQRDIEVGNLSGGETIEITFESRLDSEISRAGLFGCEARFQRSCQLNGQTGVQYFYGGVVGGNGECVFDTTVSASKDNNTCYLPLTTVGGAAPAGGTLPQLQPVQASSTIAPAADLSKTVINCKGEEKTYQQLKNELAALDSKHNSLTDGNQIKALYDNTACPSGVANSTKIQTCNGAKTLADMASELSKAGYNGPTDSGSIQAAYTRTVDCTAKAPIINSDGTITTCKEQRLAVAAFDEELRKAGYDFTGKNLETRLKDYEKAACPLGKLTDAVQTCKSPNGGPKNVEELMRDVRAANYPDQGFKNTTRQQAIQAYNNAQPECRLSKIEGYNDDQYNDCQVRGWAAAAITNNNPALQVNVKIYKGDKAELIGVAGANQTRTDLSTSRPDLKGTDYGFVFSLPNSLRGTTTPVSVYAVDPADATREVKLTNSPRNITCAAAPAPAPSTPPPTPTTTPTPGVTPTPSSGATPTPSVNPTTTPAQVYTTSFKVSETREGLAGAATFPYTSEPMLINYVFLDKTPGKKFIFVEFIASNGTTKIEAKEITLAEEPPVITALSCEADIKDPKKIKFTVTGERFSEDKGSVMLGNRTLSQDKWSSTEIKATFTDASVQATTTPTQQATANPTATALASASPTPVGRQILPFGRDCGGSIADRCAPGFSCEQSRIISNTETGSCHNEDFPHANYNLEFGSDNTARDITKPFTVKITNIRPGANNINKTISNAGLFIQNRSTDRTHVANKQSDGSYTVALPGFEGDVRMFFNFNCKTTSGQLDCSGIQEERITFQPVGNYRLYQSTTDVGGSSAVAASTTGNGITDTPQGREYTVTIKRADGFEASEKCVVGESRLSLGAQLFCREPNTFSIDDVDMVLAPVAEDGTKGQKVSKKVSISQNGYINNLNDILQTGKTYEISLKAPKSLRRVATFIASSGTTSVTNFILPVGDIFPLPTGDGVINSADKSELNAEWLVSSPSATIKPGDFNKDTRVNSIDWACMRYDFGSANQPEI